MGYYLKCVCGYAFTDALGYEHQAIVVPRSDAEDADQALLNDLQGFVEALATGRRDAWVRETFPEPYPLDITDANVLSDIMHNHTFPRSRHLRHCPDCGRLHLQLQPEGPGYRSFLPEESEQSNPLSLEPQRRR